MWNALYKIEDDMEKAHGLDVTERLNMQTGFEAGQQVIADFPAAPVQEVIHCKDCYVPHNKWTGCPKLGGLIPPSGDWFCAGGEPKR